MWLHTAYCCSRTYCCTTSHVDGGDKLSTDTTTSFEGWHGRLAAYHVRHNHHAYCCRSRRQAKNRNGDPSIFSLTLTQPQNLTQTLYRKPEGSANTNNGPGKPFLQVVGGQLKFCTSAQANAIPDRSLTLSPTLWGGVEVVGRGSRAAPRQVFEAFCAVKTRRAERPPCTINSTINNQINNT